MLQTLTDFLQPISTAQLSNDEGYKHAQLGKHIAVYEEFLPDVSEADVVLIGCNENRGSVSEYGGKSAADKIRKHFYELFYWHTQIRIADIGNIKSGATLKDTYAALTAVSKELIAIGKKVVVIGGSHDLTLAQYQTYASAKKIIEAACVDARIDINVDSRQPADKFLLEMLTSEPNYIRHYNHIGFQSYYVHPEMLETIDKLRFDCYRVGKVKENIEEMEPVIRDAQLFSFDIAAIQQAYAPANYLTPNGFTGEEACTLMQYAGMSPTVNTVGIYGYIPEQDIHELTAKQISQMLWYLIDGLYKGKQEAALQDSDNFNQFKLAFSEIEATFLQSKKTGRWWMQLPDGTFISCSRNDYDIAAANDIPERWMRAMERLT